MNGLDLLLPQRLDHQLYGVTIGVVTNNKDPDKVGRVKVKFPWLSEQEESAWARVLTPMAGHDRGFYYLPEVDDEVLVAFEHGQVEFPYILGSLWNGKDKPPESNDDGKNNQRLIKSRSGHIIILDDTEGEEKIIIRDKTAKNEVVIDSKQNTITIKVDRDLQIEAKGNIGLKSSSGDVSIDCANLKIQATQNCDIQANAQCTVQAKAGMGLNCMAGVKINDGALEVT
jgi:uncharacterized protein involved in type VI secretion and phage assembly